VSLLNDAAELNTFGYTVTTRSGKRPIGAEWQKRTPDLERVLTEIGHDRDVTGIGIVTNGLAVIDFDTGQGARNLERMILENGLEWVDTPMIARTPRGWHYFYRDPEGKVTNSGGFVGSVEGVDVRGRGGFVATPPEDEREWESGPVPIDNLPPAPWWLTGTLTSDNTLRDVSRVWEPTLTDKGRSILGTKALELETAGPGGRHQKLVEAATLAGHQIVEGDMTPAYAISRLTEAAEHAGLMEEGRGHEVGRTIFDGISMSIKARVTGLEAVLEGMRKEGY
jgi:hypothetical protein